MAQAIFEALAGMDSQTALAVQSLLESQNVEAATSQQATEVDDDDVFQCGKCKKQFVSLTQFLSHKSSRCTPPGGANNTAARLDTSTSLGGNGGSAFTPQVASYSTIPGSPGPLSHSMVLTDELINFTSIDQGIQTSNLQVVAETTSIQNSPFLSQVGPPTPNSTSQGASVVLSTSASGMGAGSSPSPTPTTATLTSSTLTSQGVALSSTAFATSISGNTVTLQPVTAYASHALHSPVAITGAEKPPGLPKTILNKPAAVTKAGRKANTIPMVTDMDGSALKQRRMKTQGVWKQEVEEPPPGTAAAPSLGNKKRMQCQYCDKTFNKNFDLAQHVRSHTGEKPFQCIVCGRAFAQKSNVKKHMQTHKVWPSGAGVTLPVQPGHCAGDPPTLTLPISKDSATIETINLNLAGGVGDGGKVNIVIDNSYVCQYCPEKFKTYFQLKTHMIKHKDEQVYKCVLRECGETFEELDSFLEHTKTHEHEMVYRCHVCNKAFPSLYELGVHQYSHSLYPNQGPKPGPRYFRCSKCNNKYATPEALEHHTQTTTHSYPCPHCEKTFTCERYLRRHLPTHGTIGDHECEVCHKRFKTEHYLKMHLLIHSGEKPFRCDVCNAAFNRKDKLKRHALIHEATKKYKCPFRTHTGCNKEFNRPDKLKAHIISHSGIKPFKCHECAKSFSRRAHLVEHSHFHRDDFSFRCEKCHRGFLREKQLKEHKCRDEESATRQPEMFRPRKTSKRKPGRPRRRMITVTEEIQKERAARRMIGRRMRNAAEPSNRQGLRRGLASVPQVNKIGYRVESLVAAGVAPLPEVDEARQMMGQHEDGIITLGEGIDAAVQEAVGLGAGDGTGLVTITGALAGGVQVVEGQTLDGQPLVTTPDGMTAQVITIAGDYAPHLAGYEGTVEGGDVAALGTATLIATGPGTATLVMNGPGGELLTENGTPIVVPTTSGAAYVTAEQLATYAESQGTVLTTPENLGIPPTSQ